MLNTDTYAYASQLKVIEPMQKFIFAILTMGVCLWADNRLISIAVIIIMSSIVILRGGTPLPYFLKLISIPMAFLIISAFTIAIGFSIDQQNFILAIPVANFWLGITQSGLQQSINLFFRVLGSVSCLYFLALSTPMVDLFSVLRKLRLPKLMIEMMELIYRFIFVLLETAGTMYTAQNSRLGYVNLVSGYRSMGSLVSALFIRSYKRSNELYTSLEARGYDGELRVLEEKYVGNKSLLYMAVGINGLLILLASVLK
ncbi:cobalt ABC transporter, permease protein CbiQ [Desulfitobacterium dichloroeliminans LMG P-21439]|uniref:Cobalt ABC transporter, permease protein CbiQ n=1 Tax=Desulfitobacterium dichloroeliminans (strain LMG P-21439 / DCA1) TaxID=871963 RepID=L0F881_DESDL|nr:cobalt ECF transporter T component CbiQ [Desulfitobacterium dichloroeliminans]AGA69245.1 cobalt ABC transporter, permease protein CbiQ [Desulfitobacterium dichloroeliminans LMG P-21439]